MAEKATRRHKGEGSIQQLPNGTYKVALTLGYRTTEDGKKKQVRRTAILPTSREAVQTLKQFQREKDENKLGPIELTTVREFAEKFLAAKKRAVKASTYKTYKNTVEARILKYIGDMMCKDVTPELVDDLVARWIADEDMSMSTIKVQRIILKAFFTMAVAHNLITANPVTNSSKVRAPKKEMRVLSQEEAKRLLGYAKEHGRGPVYQFLLLALMTGMRRGELQALCWDCVLDDKIRVWRNLIQTNEGPVVDEPKSTAGMRTISVPPWVIQELRTIKKEGQDFVFKWSAVEGSKENFTAIIDEARALKVAAGFGDVRIHDLRHTHATYLISQGVDLKTVQKRLGHEDVRLTLNLYAHWIPENDQKAGEIVGDWLGEKRAQESPFGGPEGHFDGA